MKPPIYKVGQRLEVITNEYNIEKGDIATVVAIPRGNCYKISINSIVLRGVWGLYPDYFKPIRNFKLKGCHDKS